MNTKNTLYFFCALSFALVSGYASSENEKNSNIGWFVGGSLGSATANLKLLNIENTEHTVLIGPYGGYNFAEWFGLEGRMLIGEYNSDPIGIFAITPRFTKKLNENIGLFVRTGIAFMGIAEDTGNHHDFDEDLKWAGGVTTVGVGIRLDLPRNVKLNIAYDYYSGQLQNENNGPVFRNQELDVSQSDLNMTIYYQF